MSANSHLNPPPDPCAWFRQPLRIGRVEIPNRAILAPLAGVSDVPFRRICQEMGAGLTFVEMLSARAIVLDRNSTARIFDRHPDEPRLGVQVTGGSAEDVARAAIRLEGMGFDMVDINMGCPVRKIVAKGWGSAILSDPDRLEATVARTRESVGIPVTAKIRLGFIPEQSTAEDSARRIARAGAAMLTVHGRYRGETYGVPCRRHAIRDAARAARELRPDLPVCGNGDVLTVADALRMVEETGCDAVMVSRGALGNPWLFRHLTSGRIEEPTPGEWLDVVLRHLDYHQSFHGDHMGTVFSARKLLVWYVTGFPGCRRLREELSTVDSLDTARRRIRELVATLPPDLRRFQERQAANEHPLDRSPRLDPKGDMDRRWDRAAAG